MKVLKNAQKYAKNNNFDALILDTAGRLHVDKELMNEVLAVKKIAEPKETLLVVDSLTGQDAVNVASEFDTNLDISGVVLTRMDGDGTVSYTHLTLPTNREV